MKPALIYCYDALCGWCFGFSPVIQKIEQEFRSELNFEILSGGMMLGNRTGPIGKVAPFVRTAYKTVENHTGVAFGEPFLKDLLGEGNLILNSWKPALALTAFKSMNAGNPFTFAGDLQRAMYVFGKGPDDDATFVELAKMHRLDGNSFVAFMQSTSIQEQTKAEFRRVGDYGVNGFPALLFDFGGDFAHFASGFRDYETLKAALAKILV